MSDRLAHRGGRSSQATSATVDKSPSASNTEFLTTPLGRVDTSTSRHKNAPRLSNQVAKRKNSMNRYRISYWTQHAGGPSSIYTDIVIAMNAGEAVRLFKNSWPDRNVVGCEPA